MSPPSSHDTLKKAAGPGSQALRLALAAMMTLFPGVSATLRAQGTGNVPGSYWVYVANESSDLVSRVRFGPEGAVEEKTISVGIRPADLEGAHGLTIAPAGDYWYVSLAHGTPYGKIWKFETGSDRFADSVTVGLFPATMALTGDGSTLVAANFNLHGPQVPSGVSLVFAPFMDQMAQIETCVMPHGSQITHDGLHHYSACMMSDQLVEIDMERQLVTRRLSLSQGAERLLEVDSSGTYRGAGACKPTWVALAPDDSRAYIPCNGRDQILEIELDRMVVARKIDTGRSPYNAAVSPDGHYLVATLKADQAVAIVDLTTGLQARVATSEPLSHGVAISPDSRYAFVSNESVGARRGSLDVIDLTQSAIVASTKLQLQPGGIGFWKMVETAGADD